MNQSTTLPQSLKWKMGPSNIGFLSCTLIFHFHEYERKGIQHHQYIRIMPALPFGLTAGKYLAQTLVTIDSHLTCWTSMKSCARTNTLRTLSGGVLRKTMVTRGKQLCWTWTSSTNSEPLTLAFLIVRLLSLCLSVLLKAVTSLLWVASWALGGRRLVLGVAALCTRTSCQQRNIANSDSLFGPIFGPTKSWPWNWRTWKCRYP